MVQLGVPSAYQALGCSSRKRLARNADHVVDLLAQPSDLIHHLIALQPPVP